ncbi:MAG: PD-(D/E)XK nuclease family protein [Bacteroidales bacterium]|nr:PD-(D/E)XK nuclease family protein [Bacteroidales bacterium]
MEVLPENSWLPEIITIDDLMLHLSGLTLADALVVDFELYKIHQDIEGENARAPEDFLSWAPLMINDFSDIDYYLTDAKTLFSELTDIKALERWNLGEKPLTEIQKNYLKFFQSLYGYYSKLKDALLEKNMAYKAMAYRYVVENYEEKIKNNLGWQYYVFAGFNALTESEKKLMIYLKNDFRFDYLVDVDSFYFDNQKKTHEASKFIHQALKSLKITEPNWIDNELLNSSKTLEVVGVPKYMGQVGFAAQVLQKWFSNENYDPANTLVVMAEEDLLIPLLNSVPVKTSDGTALRYNVSLGYPLTNGPFANFVLSWLEMLNLRNEDSASRIPVASLLGLFKSPVLELLGQQSDISAKLKGITSFYIEAEELLQAGFSDETKELFQIIFGKLKNPGQFLLHLGTFLQRLQSVPEFQERTNALINFQFVLIFRLTKVLQVMLEGKMHNLNFKSLQKIMVQVLNRQEINLKGEPLTGIQIMGMLETRSLDFENVIILGANEGILPKSGFSDSFIPFDLRKNHGLPLPDKKSAIFSYHFFRLLQRAKHVVYLYNSEPDVFGNGEPSRFIRQIEHELVGKNPNLVFKKELVNTPLRETDIQTEIKIEKSSEVLSGLKELAENGISPSALNSFIKCTLQFYLKYVLKIEVPDPVEASVRSDTFGSVVHGVLETLYKPFAGHKIDAELLEKEFTNIDLLLKEGFDKHYGVRDMNYGKNLLIFEVARAYIERFIKNDISYLKITERQLEGVEMKFKAPFTYSGGHVNLKGIIDRVDQIPGESGVRIMDYKTGSVNEYDLKIKDWDSLITDEKYSKAFQVLTYAWLYLAKNPTVKQVKGTLVSMKSASGKPVEVSFSDDQNIDQLLPLFEEQLDVLLTAMFDTSKPFVQTEEVERCSYCDFKNMCNR